MNIVKDIGLPASILGIVIYGLIIYGFIASIVHREWQLVGVWLILFGIMATFFLALLISGRKEYEAAVRRGLEDIVKREEALTELCPHHVIQ